MSVLERLNAAVDIAQAEGREIEEIDLTNADYADLMALGILYDEASLPHMEVDFPKQKYRGYKMAFDRQLPESSVVRDDGVLRLPTDTEAREDERVVVGK